jgi:uncharacterized protein RhaS with RHS repeats
LDMLPNQYYNPVIGRFISEDPIGFAGKDSNLYRYVQNNSLKYSDPSGKLLFLAAGPAIAAAAGKAALYAATGLAAYLAGSSLADGVMSSSGDDNNFGVGHKTPLPGEDKAPQFNGKGPSPGSELLAKIAIGGTILYGLNQCQEGE